MESLSAKMVPMDHAGPRKKILLLNLPFLRPVQRDYGCPHGIKAAYCWPPIDLVMFGAAAGAAGEIEYLDCIAGRVGPDEALERVKRANPDIVFSVISSITLENDLRFLVDVKRALPAVSLWASGDLVFFTSGEYPPLDVYLRDLTNRAGILELLAQDSPAGVVGSASGGTFSQGIFPHELLKSYGYCMPYSFCRGITAVLTNYGCPYRCTFCNSNRIPFKRRDMADLLKELEYIKGKGIREVLFRDFTFNASDAEQLCDEMTARGIDLRWSCWTRMDLVNGRILAKMKQAGCYLVSYGIESCEPWIQEKTGKNLDVPEMREKVAMTRAAGLEVLASVILGFPGEDPQLTISRIKEIDPDYLAVNLLVPRVGSALANEYGEVSVGDGADSLLSGNVSLTGMRDRLEREFYLRPGKLLRYLRLALRSPQRLAVFVRNARGIAGRWR